MFWHHLESNSFGWTKKKWNILYNKLKNESRINMFMLELIEGDKFWSFYLLGPPFAHEWCHESGAIGWRHVVLCVRSGSDGPGGDKWRLARESHVERLMFWHRLILPIFDPLRKTNKKENEDKFNADIYVCYELHLLHLLAYSILTHNY